MLVGVISHKVIREMQKKKARPGSDLLGYIDRDRGGAGGATTVDVMNLYPVALGWDVNPNLPHHLAFTTLCVLSMYTECLISSEPPHSSSRCHPINNAGPPLSRLGVS